MCWPVFDGETQARSLIIHDHRLEGLIEPFDDLYSWRSVLMSPNGFEKSVTRCKKATLPQFLQRLARWAEVYRAVLYAVLTRM